jgi:hypothetical protein
MSILLFEVRVMVALPGERYYTLPRLNGEGEMSKRFFYISLGILCLVAAYQLGVERARAEWDVGAPGQIIGGAFTQDGPWVAITSSGEAWSVAPAVGWIRRADIDPPVAASHVKFLDSNGEVFILITTVDDVWEFVDNDLGWFEIDSFPGGPISAENESWGRMKEGFR